MKRKIISLASILLLVSLTACDTGGTTSTSSGSDVGQATTNPTPTMAMDMGNPAATPNTGTQPTIRILAPANGATVSGDRLTITTRKSNFLYNAPATNQVNKAGQGNYRIFVDGTLATEDFGDVTALPTDLLPKLSVGEHTIDVKLYNNDGTPYAGAQNARIKVRVANAMSYTAKSGNASLSIVGQPQPDGFGHFVIQAEVSGYVLDGTRVNNKPEPGMGHYHVYVDGGKLANVGVGSISSIPSDLNPDILTPGEHNLHIVLETHQHSPIPGGESQTITFTVRPQDTMKNEPSPQSQYFPQTGFWLAGKFLDYWQKNGSLARQGYPISTPRQEQSDLNGQMYTVQYFERAVFELHPENAAPNDVQLSQLGRFRYKEKYPNGAASQRPSTATPLRFTETDKVVGGKFLAYWQQQGGLAQFGLPISNEFSEKSELDSKTYTVQYFERATFELHPENKVPYDVLLTQLGTLRYAAKH